MSYDYKIFDPKVNKPLHELSRKEAKEAYEWFMSQKENRKQALLSLAEALGFSPRNTDQESVAALHELFVSEIRREGRRIKPSSYVYSLCNDIAVVLSEMLISNAPNLSWGMHTARKSDLSYQRPVIRGFNVKNKDYSVDIDYLLCQYAHRLCDGGNKEEGLLWEIYRGSLQNA